MNKILITGATGFIGNEIINRILQINNKHKITPIGRRIKKWNASFTKKNIKYINLKNDLISNLGKFDTIIHCASISDINKTYEWHDYFDNNILPTLRLLEEINYKRFILISTGSVFSDNAKNIKPNSLYGLSKYISEKLVSVSKNNINKQYMIFRLPIVIGNNSQNNFINEFAENMIKDNNVEIYGNGKIKRDIIHVNDVANIISLACFNKNYKMKSGIFHIGSTKTMTIIDIAKLIKKLLKSSSEISITNKVRRTNIDAIINLRNLKETFKVELRSTNFYIRKYIDEKYI